MSLQKCIFAQSYRVNRLGKKQFSSVFSSEMFVNGKTEICEIHDISVITAWNIKAQKDNDNGHCSIMTHNE